MNLRSHVAWISEKSPFLGEQMLRANCKPWLLGPHYASRLRNFWSTDSATQLLSVVSRAISTAPFYRARYSRCRIGSVSEFKAAFSTIDKEIVLDNFDAFIADDIDIRRYDQCTTGGTSGKPLRLVLPKGRYVYEFAALHNVWAQVGYRFSPRAVVRNERLAGRDFTINPLLREYVFDGFRTSDDYLARIYEVMRDKQIGFYHGYTSNAYEFARFISRERLDHSFLKAFITTSENFYEHQRPAFEALDRVKHLNFYGHSEKLVLGAYCSASGLYHFHQQYGFCELLDEHGSDVSEIGQVGEIVGSTLYNTGMPLLRYRTGDYARYAGDGRCQHCGHNGMSASHILGRWVGDRIYNGDGSYVTTTALNLHSELYGHIDGLQYVQEHPGELTVRVIPGEGYSDSVAARLRADVASKLHPATVVTVSSSERLQRTNNGKFLLLVSKCAAPAVGR